MQRKVEIIAFERERIIRRNTATLCLACRQPSELLTTRQAAVLLQVRPDSIRRWLMEGRAHGCRTPGGQHRVCRASLFAATQAAEIPL